MPSFPSHCNDLLQWKLTGQIFPPRCTLTAWMEKAFNTWLVKLIWRKWCGVWYEPTGRHVLLTGSADQRRWAVSESTQQADPPIAAHRSRHPSRISMDFPWLASIDELWPNSFRKEITSYKGHDVSWGLPWPWGSFPYIASTDVFCKLLPPILLHCQCLPQWRWRTMGVEGSRWNWFYLLRPSFDRIFSAHTETSRQESWYSNYPVAWHLQTNLQKISPWKVSRSTASTVIVKLPLENYRVLLSPNEYPLFLFWKK